MYYTYRVFYQLVGRTGETSVIIWSEDPIIGNATFVTLVEKKVKKKVVVLDHFRLMNDDNDYPPTMWR